MMAVERVSKGHAYSYTCRNNGTGEDFENVNY